MIRSTQTCQHPTVVRDWTPEGMTETCSECDTTEMFTLERVVGHTLSRLDVAERRVAAIEARIPKPPRIIQRIIIPPGAINVDLGDAWHLIANPRRTATLVLELREADTAPEGS